MVKSMVKVLIFGIMEIVILGVGVTIIGTAKVLISTQMEELKLNITD